MLMAMPSGRPLLDRAIQPKIFICYRRSDSSGESSHLAHRLGAKFGRSKIFFDINAIESGVNYEQALAKAREAARVMLVIIGDQWLSAKEPSGQRRIDEQDDPVRVELRTGLKRGIVLPVLVKGAKMPPYYELPGDVSELASIQASRINHETFDRDFADLVNTVDKRLPEGDASDAPRITGADHVIAGGALDPHSAIYIDREADMRVAEFLKSGSSELLVHAPRMFGKSSLLVKAILRARDDGRATAYIDLSQFSAELSFRQLILALASEMSEQLTVRFNEESLAREPLTAFLDMVVTTPMNSLIVIDELDMINACSSPEAIGDLLATLPKLCKTSEASSSYILAGIFTSVEYSHITQAFSGVNAIELSHFNSVETRLFFERARIPLSDSEFAELFSLTGGHPFLVAVSARALSDGGTVLNLVNEAPQRSGPFGPHVEWVIECIRNMPPVRDGMCALSRGEPASQNSKPLLQRLGLVKQRGNQLHFACSFYKRLVSGECEGGGHSYRDNKGRRLPRLKWHANTVERIKSLVRRRGDVSIPSPRSQPGAE